MGQFNGVMVVRSWERTKQVMTLYGRLNVGGLERIGGSFPSDDWARAYAAVEFPDLPIITSCERT